MREQIVAKVKIAGVVGAGGAGFPTHVKLNAGAGMVIVNGAECEPLLRVDQQLMAKMPDLLIKGLEAAMAATGAKEGVIALKGKYRQAIEALKEKLPGKPIRLFMLGDFYPAGDEHVTVYEITGKVIPEGGIPLNVGCVVSNVESLINVALALEDRPVTHTYVTVTGEVPKPVTLNLPLGTLIADVLKFSGLDDLKDKVVIDGGPMMGKVIENFSVPITKTTKGLIVLSRKHPLMEQRLMPLAKIMKMARTVCIQCFRCTDMCPRHMLGHQLSPHKIMRTVGYLTGEPTATKMALSCTECGACEFACDTMHLSPRRVNGLIKRELMSNGIKLTPSAGGETPVSTREYMKIPVKRLVSTLGLKRYNVDAPLEESEFSPKVVKIPLRQHIGRPAVPVVRVSQRVEQGSLIGEIPEGALGANIHASIAGVVKEVSDNIVIEGDGGVQF